MDITSIMTGMYIPTVMIFCLIVGYILKHWVKDLDNKIIPTVLAVLGACAACLSAWDFSLELIVSGALSGLASTGLHQVFKHLIGDKNE